MKQYILKSDIVAEIEKLKAELHPDFYEYDYDAAKAELLEKIEVIINAIETKEVDLKEERMKDCPYRVVGCEKYSGTVTECNGACAWVVDCLKLKELKAKKGE